VDQSVCRNSFIITITGPSASGKSYVTDRIIGAATELQDFVPVPFPKFTTRDPRLSDIRANNEGKFVDNISVSQLPDDCDLVYRTYGYEYGLNTDNLKTLLAEQKHPIVVINDVRAVEELKSIFPERVFSLFLYRSVPEPKQHKRVAASRGNVEAKEAQSRYDKAIAMFRVYIENITLFDRVILNVKDFIPDLGDIDYTKTQIVNALRGVVDGRIKLSEKANKSPHLFIISGNASSGKDDVIRAVQKMGKLQSTIIPKYTSRRVLSDDGDEMICKHIPNRKIMDTISLSYNATRAKIEKRYSEAYDEKFRCKCLTEYEKTKKADSLDDFCSVQWEIEKLKKIKKLATPIISFWKRVSKAQLKGEASNEKLLDEFFELNPVLTPDMLTALNQQPKEEAIVQSIAGDEYIVYWNHKNTYSYIFPISSVKADIDVSHKHCVLVASLPKIFELCRTRVGEDRVVVIYAYSQVSKEDFATHTDGVIGEAYQKSWDDLIRYSENIVDFDYVIIYATQKMEENSGGQKEELIDQIFRLFRAYN
jgi:guanylate kinase